MAREYCVISHTHWDREWYVPFEQFRTRLAAVLDIVLDLLDREAEYVFHLDGQTVVIEDYLEIRPSVRKRVQSFVAEGRLIIGPWYVQNDFYLATGEATIRNLLIGMRIAGAFGRCMMVGYAPDQFGLVSQLPQILSKMGINSCIFGRGRDRYEQDTEGRPVRVFEAAEFRWLSEDGSQILGIQMPFWYNNAQWFPEDPDKALDYLRKAVADLDQASATPYRLLMNGLDHQQAQENLLPILRGLNERMEAGERIHQGRLEDYVAQVEDYLRDRAVACERGELRFGDDRGILQGTLSSRVGLKQMNARCQLLLERKLEPLYSWLVMHGVHTYPREHLDYLWKLLIRNHAHDSICGCSTDEVCGHIEDRLARVEEGSALLIEEAARFINLHTDRSGLGKDWYLLTVFNMGIHDGSSVLEAEVHIDRSLGAVHLELVDNDNQPAELVVLESKDDEVRFFKPADQPAVTLVRSFRIRFFAADVKAQGYKTYLLRPVANESKSASLASVPNPDARIAQAGEKESRAIPAPAGQPAAPVRSAYTLENEYLRVSIDSDGTIELTHLATGNSYRRLLCFEDREDIGDSYLYYASAHGQTVLSTSCRPEISLSRHDALVTEYTVTYRIEFPAEYDYAGMCRSRSTSINRIQMTLRLEKGSPLLLIGVKCLNQARDHRLRLLVPTGIPAAVSQAGSIFDFIRRDKTEIMPWLNESATQPFTGFVNVDGSRGGLAVYAAGLYEYENLSDDLNTLAITLLRCNEAIYKPDRNMPPTTAYRVPGNQCPGTHHFQLALYPHAGDCLTAEVPAWADRFLSPLFCCCLPAEKDLYHRGNQAVQQAAAHQIYARTDPYDRLVLPTARQHLLVDGRDIALSAMKQKEQGNALILRLYNLGSETRQATVGFGCKLREAYLDGLDETRQHPLAIENGTSLILTFKPKEILTIEAVPENMEVRHAGTD